LLHPASATYDLNNTVQLFGRVQNLGDQQYEEIIGFGTPMRSVFGGAKFAL
jgi:vitamin B12 transporter